MGKGKGDGVKTCQGFDALMAEDSWQLHGYEEFHRSRDDERRPTR